LVPPGGEEFCHATVSRDGEETEYTVLYVCGEPPEAWSDVECVVVPDPDDFADADYLIGLAEAAEADSVALSCYITVSAE
jgi:hypothetical protein